MSQYSLNGPDILTAAKRNNVKYMRWLLAQGVSDKELLSEALLIACQRESKGCVSLLLVNGDDPNWKGYSEAAYNLILELHEFSLEGDPSIIARTSHEILLLLLKSGADLSLPIDSYNVNTSSLDLEKNMASIT